MKKAAIIAGAVFFLFAASVSAQNDTVPVSPATPVTPVEPATPTEPETTTQPATTTTANPVTANAPVVTSTTKVDQWNSHDPEKYKHQPMPEPLTIDKIFPALGNYAITDKEGASSTVNISIDPENKGTIWVEGLPQGKFKAYLRKSPGVYKIPAQKLEDDKSLAEGVLIYDKDANLLDVCIGCSYKAEDPAVAFLSEEAQQEAEVMETETKVKKGTVKSKTKTKVKPVKTWRYSGSKNIEETAVAPGTPLQ
jgi:hypothetical protein